VDAVPAGSAVNAGRALGRRRGSTRRHYDLPPGAGWRAWLVHVPKAWPVRRATTPPWRAARRPSILVALRRRATPSALEGGRKCRGKAGSPGAVQTTRAIFH